MVDCDKAIALLSDYMDNLLEPSIKHEIDALLEKDQQCRRIFSDALAQREKLQQLTMVRPSEDFDQNLRTRILALSSPNEKPVRSNIKGIPYIFSGLVLVIAVYFMMFTNVGTEQQPVDIQPSSTISAPATATRMLPATQKNITASDEIKATKDSSTHSQAKPMDKKAIKLVGEGH